MCLGARPRILTTLRALGECRAYTDSLQNEQFILPHLHILQWTSPKFRLGEGTFSKNLLNKDFKNFTKFFRNKIYENLKIFRSFCENIKHCELNVTVFCKIIKVWNLF